MSETCPDQDIKCCLLFSVQRQKLRSLLERPQKLGQKTEVKVNNIEIISQRKMAPGMSLRCVYTTQGQFASCLKSRTFYRIAKSDNCFFISVLSLYPVYIMSSFLMEVLATFRPECLSQTELSLSLMYTGPKSMDVQTRGCKNRQCRVYFL